MSPAYPEIVEAALGAPAAGGGAGGPVEGLEAGGGGGPEMTERDAILKLESLFIEHVKARVEGRVTDSNDLLDAYDRLLDQWPSISIYEIFSSSNEDSWIYRNLALDYHGWSLDEEGKGDHYHGWILEGEDEGEDDREDDQNGFNDRGSGFWVRYYGNT
jgi:hypothetical protein